MVRKNLGVKVVECEFTDDKIIEKESPSYINEYLDMVINEDLSKNMVEKQKSLIYNKCQLNGGM